VLREYIEHYNAHTDPLVSSSVKPPSAGRSRRAERAEQTRRRIVEAATALFEVLWKVIWIAAVALPHLVADDLDAATRAVLVNCFLVVIIIAVIPWRYVWERYIRAPADAWR
jgi:hypothetical protein